MQFVDFELRNNAVQCKHAHPFNSPLSGTTRVSWYQKGKTNLNYTEARDSEWQWHQLGHMQQLGCLAHSAFCQINQEFTIIILDTIIPL